MLCPLRNHSYYSLLQAIPSPEDIIGRCKKLEYTAAGLTDKNSLSGTIKFYKSAKKAGIKPLLGMELELLDTNRPSSLLLFAQNQTGWQNLLHIGKELPSSFEDLSKLDVAGLICISGYSSSDLDIEGPGARVSLHKELFGNNFYLALDHLSPSLTHGAKILARDYSLKTVSLNNSHYCEESDKQDLGVLICGLLKTNFKKLNSVLEAEKNSNLRQLLSNRLHIPTKTEIPFEEDNLAELLEKVEIFDILSRPRLIKYVEDGDNHLLNLCRQGWTAKIQNNIPREKQEVYKDRIKLELDVIARANLSNYFLVVQDYVNAAKNRGELVGCARGSGAGSLISYLIGITNIDPIRYNLLFERFYNEGRNTADRVALPDIDVDFMRGSRHTTIEYIKDKYGHENVAQMCTFGRMQGRAALKEVLRATGEISFEEMNSITEPIPDEAKIADELQEAKDAGEEPSIIRWVLENNPDKVAEYCRLDGEELVGPMADKFAQAIRLEGVKRSQSKHASGLIISPTPINSVSPMVKDKSGTEYLVGVEMSDAEDLGLVKYDILGVALLDRIDTARKLTL